MVEGTTDEATQNPTVQDLLGDTGVVPKNSKSPWTLRPKKDKQAMGLVRMSPRNPQFGKLSMEEKGKAVTIETDDEKEDLQALVDEIDAAEDMEEEI